MRVLIVTLSLATLLTVAGCGRERKPGPVRSKQDAVYVAKRHAGTLAFKGTRVKVQRNGDTWVVRGEDRADPARAVVVSIDNATGEVVELAGVSYGVSLVKPEP